MAVDLLSLVAKIGINDKEYIDGVKGAETRANKAGKAIKAGFKVAAAGISVAAGAIVSIGKVAIDNYAEYEQLAGGAKLMFGDAYDYIAKKAQNAYATVQMSQNEYLQQVNGFATGLKTALGGNEKAAAELADKIVQAEADVVAATGNAQENVQNAFNGIMKNNYTMLDNLQLGIKPTKDGMQEVIDKVNEWNAAQGNLTNYTIDNLADQQSALVDYISMVGMSGYAQKEAMGTIQGSLAATKAAWSNVLTAMTDDEQEFGAAIDGLVSSAGAFVSNIIPRIENVFSGVSTLIAELGEKALPQIVNLLPTIFESLLPAAIAMVQSLFTKLASIIPDLIPIILNSLPLLINAGLEIVLALMTGITENIPTLTPAIIDVVNQIVTTLTEPDTLSALILAAGMLMLTLIEALGSEETISGLTGAITTITGNIINLLTDPKFLKQLGIAGLKILISLAKGIITEKAQIGLAMNKINTQIKDKFKEIKDKAKSWGRDLLQNFINGISEKIYALKEKVQSVVKVISDKLKHSVPKEGDLSDDDVWGVHFMDNIISGIDKELPKLNSAIGDVTGAMNFDDGYYDNYGYEDSVQQFEFTFAEGKAPLLQIARLIFPYMQVVAKEKGVKA